MFATSHLLFLAKAVVCHPLGACQGCLGPKGSRAPFTLCCHMWYPQISLVLCYLGEEMAQFMCTVYTVCTSSFYEHNWLVFFNQILYSLSMDRAHLRARSHDRHWNCYWNSHVTCIEPACMLQPQIRENGNSPRTESCLLPCPAPWTRNRTPFRGGAQWTFVKVHGLKHSW